VSYDHSIGSPAHDTVSETGRAVESPSTPTDIPEGGTHGGGETKRKYRRHPKPDENAPSRAPSAYVIFSNKIREDVRGQNMSFTDIAKLVGDRWQKLGPSEKEPFETRATRAKEKYNTELAGYKKTDSYRDYMRYLVEFKTKHGGSTTDSKRPRLANESSNGSLSAKSTEAPEISVVPTNHIRVGSMGTVGSTMSQGELGSPIPLTPYPGQGTSTRLPPMSPSTDTTALLPPHDQWQYTAFSSQSSVSDESTTVREYPDPLPHAAQLSLLPGPGRMAENPAQSPTTAEFMRMPAANRRPVRARTPLGAHPSGSESNSRSSASSRSNINSSEGSFIFANSNSSVDETWPLQPSETMRPALSKSTSIPHCAVTLPPLIASERLPDVIQDQSQRILPLPTTSASPEGYHGLRSLPRLSTMTGPRHQDLSGFGLSSRVSVEKMPPLQKSESEAADVLAGLAYGSLPRQPPGQGGNKRPP
jgi:HMG (high mobility group) box